MRTTALLMGILLCAAGSQAVDLAPTPISDAVRFNLLMADKNDEFQNDESTRSAELSGKREGKKSMWKAAALSAVVPGGGEWYLGNRRKAKYFFVADALTWIGFGAFRMYGNMREDDMINFAATNANAHLDGKSEEFLDLVGFYSSIDEYNTLGRVSDPERPFLYDTPENHWRWQSEDDQAIYRHMKNRSREAFRRSEFMIGVAVVTRLISIVDAVRDAKRAERRIDTFSGSPRKSFRVAVSPFQDTRQIQLTLYPGL